jgi:hypothetical protein
MLEFTRHRRILASVPSDTQTGRPIIERLSRSPLALSLVVVLANAAKPVLIDDTAYLAFARHIAQHPADPYGFTFFWYAKPEPAFEILAPPVVPYWLSLGYRLFGENVPLLKLWQFPFVWLFAWAAGDLLRRFARGDHFLAVVVLSPAVLPAVNLMLDIPAVGLGLASIALIVRALDRNSWRLALASGLVAALAMQAKYTMLVIPPVLFLYGLTQARTRRAAAAVAIAIGGFVSWELFLVQQYGRSHFAHHASTRSAESRPGLGQVRALVSDKVDLAPGLEGHFGCLGLGAGLIGAGSVGVPRRWIAVMAGAWVVGFSLIALLPGRLSARWVYIYWQFSGVIFLAAIIACGALLILRCRKGVGSRRNADSLFLVGWLVLELAATFVLTPFPAARRIILLAVAGLLLAARAESRMGRVLPSRRPARWVSIAAGGIVAAIDVLDAFPEKYCAERAAALTGDRPAGSTVWYAGHWGFQFYCEREGMRPVVPGESRLAPGDYLVLPVHPDPPGFFRPHFGSTPLAVRKEEGEVVAEIVWEDGLSAQTVPNYYGGINPVVGRDPPRLRVVVYRIVRSWEPPADQRR